MSVITKQLGNLHQIELFRESYTKYMKLKLSPGKTVAILACIALFLLFANISVLFSKYALGHDHLMGIVNIFDLNREANFPTFFATFTLFLCSGLFTLIYLSEKENSKYSARYWLGLAVVFLFLSFDESLSFHERLSTPIREFAHLNEYLYFAWVIPYGVLSFILFLVYLKFLFNLPVRYRNLFLVSGTVFITGAIGFELFGAKQYSIRISIDPNLVQPVHENIIYALTYTCEETLEMTGVLILIYALMSYIDRELGELRLSIHPEDKKSSSH